MKHVAAILGHFAKMTAPDRPMAGAFATLRQADALRHLTNSARLHDLRLAPTRPGAAIFTSWAPSVKALA